MTTTNQHGLRPAPIGSVSTGTLRTEDLLSKLGRELEELVFVNGDFLARPENWFLRNRLNSVLGEWQEKFGDDGMRDEVEAQEFLEELFDALDLFAPDGSSFGAHEGDGANFGFWPNEQEEGEQE